MYNNHIRVGALSHLSAEYVTGNMKKLVASQQGLSQILNLNVTAYMCGGNLSKYYSYTPSHKHSMS